MLIVTFANFFAIIVTTLGRILKNERTFFLLAIVCLIAFYSIRRLPGYHSTFERISNFTSFDYNDENVECVEPGFLLNFFICSTWLAIFFILSHSRTIFNYLLADKKIYLATVLLFFSIYILNSSHSFDGFILLSEHMRERIPVK